ncbi:MAG: hypothetical protein ABR975_03650 [Vulcanimicrobiaceae bacterium]|jgi:DNA-binding CsgD family transcriptional regulator/thioredoxin-like negative regulator of GroEL
MRKLGEQIAISDVRDAYLRGEFERCLDFCDKLDPRDDNEEVEVALLRTRALLLLGRADRALDALRRIPSHGIDADASLVKEMLTGVGYSRLGQTERGVELLQEAFAKSENAHGTVRADVAVNFGVALYHNHEYDRALQVLRSVPEDADILHARAILYIGWVARASDLGKASALFEAALRRLDACVRYDRFVEASALYGATLACAETLRTDSWDDIRRRASRVDWSSGLAIPRFWFAICSSWVAEIRGDIEGARIWAADAEERAPNDSSRVSALCRLAALFGRYGEVGAHAYFTRKAGAIYEQLAAEAISGEGSTLSIALAEELIEMGAFDEAETLLAFYRDVMRSNVRVGPESASNDARLHLVEGSLAEARGDRSGALGKLREAFVAYRELGLPRSAVIAAYRLAMLGETEPREYAERVLANAHDRYWVRARLVAPSTEIRLTEAQADVLRLVAAGRTNKEIATARGISFFRARNVVADLLAIFGATNRTELGRVAAAHGLVPTPAAQQMRLRKDAARVG